MADVSVKRASAAQQKQQEHDINDSNDVTSPTILPPSPRPTVRPLSWRWACHKCGQIYNLGCTRRCLRCSHYICLGSAALGAERSKNSARKSCQAEFDYGRWRDRLAWRRERVEFEAGPYEWKMRAKMDMKYVDSLPNGWRKELNRRKIKEWRRKEREDERHARLGKGTHDCSIDCDYPSQCHKERYEAITANTPPSSCGVNSPSDDASDSETTTGSASPVTEDEVDEQDGPTKKRWMDGPEDEERDSPRSPVEDGVDELGELDAQRDWDIWEDSTQTDEDATAHLDSEESLFF